MTAVIFNSPFHGRRTQRQLRLTRAAGTFSSDTNTGCGTQHPHRALGGTCVLLAAAPTTPPCFRHWRRSSSLHSSHIQRKNYFYFRASGASADAPLAHFHEEGSKEQAAFTAIKTKSPGGRVLSGEERTDDSLLICRSWGSRSGMQLPCSSA